VGATTGRTEPWARIGPAAARNPPGPDSPVPGPTHIEFPGPPPSPSSGSFLSAHFKASEQALLGNRVRLAPPLLLQAEFGQESSQIALLRASPPAELTPLPLRSKLPSPGKGLLSRSSVGREQ